MKYTKFVIKTHPVSGEAMETFLFELGSSGVLLEDPNELDLMEQEGVYWDYVDTAVNTDMDTVTIQAFFDHCIDNRNLMDQIHKKLDALESYGLKRGLGTVVVEEVEESSWTDEWKKYYQIIHIGEHFVIKPQWEDYMEQKGDIVLELEPGMAFGTGAHESTELSLRLMEEVHFQNRDVIDIGCGSGILSVASAKLGAKRVLGIDIDPLAVQVAHDNVAMNGDFPQVEIKEGNLSEEVSDTFDVVISNIVAEAIRVLAVDIPRILQVGGLWISSGILNDQREELMRIMKENGFQIVQTLEKNEWSAILARKE